MYEFLKLLAVTHEVKPTEKIMKDGTRETVFNGPSPDEITLVDFARQNGFQIYSTSDNEYVVKVLPESGLIHKEANHAENHKGDDDPPNENSISGDAL